MRRTWHDRVRPRHGRTLATIGALCLGLVAAPLVGAAPTARAADLGLSADFEDGLGAWGLRGSAPATAAVTDAEAHTGTHSALVSLREQAWHGLGVSLTGLIPPGRSSTVSGWVKLAAGEPGPADLRLSVQRDLAGTSSYDTLATIEDVTADTWVPVTVTSTLPAADTALLYWESVSSLSSFVVDDITVEVSDAPPVQTGIPGLRGELPWPTGVAIDTRETDDPGATLVTHHYGQITAENDMKPEELQPTEGVFTFEDADRLMDFAVDHDLRVYGHTLVWHSQTPAWFFQHPDGTPLTTDPADRLLLRDRLRTHIETVAEHFRGKYGAYGTAGNPIVAFDVVNEAIAESESDGLRRSEWYRILGPGYIDEAFALASEAFNGGQATGPVQLFLNDYNTEQPAKRAAMLAVVRDLVDADVPIDGVGHQLHLNLSQPIAQIRTTLDAFAGLGLHQAVTELDVQIDGTVTQDKLIEQGYYYADLFDVLREHPDLFSVTVWGPYDSRSWRTGAPLPFDDALQAKPAYWGIVDRTQLPERTLAVDVPRADAPDALEWELLPLTPVADGTGFALRWTTDRLWAYVEVQDATDDGAQDTVTLFGSPGPVTVARDGSVGSGAEVRPTATGYVVIAPVPLAAAALDLAVPFDVRIADGSGDTASWNDLTHTQESGGTLGTATLVEPVARVAVPEAGAAPVVDGERDAVWDDAATIGTDVQVEGSSGATAQVHVLWTPGAVHLLFEVADPVLDATSSNAWEQDSVEVFLDPVNAKSGPYNPADGQYRISYDNAVSISGDLSVIGQNLTSATRVVDGGYVVEATLALGDRAAGDLVGLDVQVNDATAGVRQSVCTWADPTGRSYQNTSRWGVAQLVAAAPTIKLGQVSVAAGRSFAVALAGFAPGTEVALALTGPEPAPATARAPETASAPETVRTAETVRTPATARTTAADTVALAAAAPRAAAVPVAAAEGVLGTVTVGPDRAATARLTVPTTTAPGEYLLVASTGGVVLTDTPLTVLAAVVVPTAPGSLGTPSDPAGVGGTGSAPASTLADTGASIRGLLVLALALTAVGSCLVRRRITAGPTTATPAPPRE